MAIHIADAYVDIEAKDQTQADVDKIMERLRSLGPVEIGLKIDDQTRDDIDRISERLQRLGPVSIELKIDDDTQAETQRLMQRLRDLGPVNIGINLDMDAAAIRAQLESLRGSIRIPVEVSDNTFPGLSAVYTEFERFRLLSSRLLNIPVTAHDNLDVGLGQAYAEMLMFRQLAEHTLRIPVSTSGGVNFPGLGGAAGQAGQQAAGQAQMITAAVVAAFPAISVAVGGAATVAVGAVLAAIPIMAWKSSTEVKAAYSDLWTDLKGGIREITPEWEGLLVKMTGTLRNAGAEWKPFFKDLFADLGPGMDSFLTNLVSGLDILQPSIRQIIDGFDAMAPALGAQLPKVLEGITSGFAHLAQGIEDHPEMFGQLLIDLGQVVDLVGQLGQASMALLPILDVTYGNIEDLNSALGATVGFFQSFGDAMDAAGVDSGAFSTQLGSLTQTIMSFAGGPIGIALDGWNKYKGAQEAAGASGVTFNNIMDAINASVYAAVTADAELTAKQTELVDIMNTAGMSAADLKDKLDALTGKTLTQREATRAFEKSIDDMTAALKKNGKTHDDNTPKGRANAAALDNIAKAAEAAAVAIRDNGGSLKSQDAVFDRARKKIIASAEAMGYSSKKAKGLADDLLGVRDAANKVPASKTAKIKGEINDLQTKLAKAMNILALVPPSKRSALLVNIAQLQTKIREAQSELGSIHDKTVTVRIKVDRIGGIGKLTAAEKGQADGSVRTFADGAENHVAQIARPGEYRLWAEDETGGEAYIPLSRRKRARSLAILEDVARRFGVMVARPMEDGGLLSFAAGGVGDELGVKHNTGDDLGVVHNGSGGLVGKEIWAAAVKAALVQKKLLDEIAAAGKKLLAGITKAMLSSLDKINAYAENLNATIKKYLSGAQEKAALKWANAIEAKMRNAATAAEEIAATIKEAKEFAANTKNTLVSGAGIGGLGAIGNAQDVKSGLQFRAGEMQRFADQIGRLAGLGLNKNILMDIIGYGPQQGGALADMLLKDTGTFAAINSAQASIEAAAGAIGNQAADAMYDTGAHAADGFLTGLYAKQKDLQALMASLGEQLAAGIKKVLAEAKAATSAATAKAKAVTDEVIRLNKSKDEAIRLNKSTDEVIRLNKSGTKARARGGIVEAGAWALVGEEGPELVNFGSRGNVHTATETAGMLGGGVTFGDVHIQVNGTFDFSDPAAAERVAEQIVVAVQEKIRLKERSKR